MYFETSTSSCDISLSMIYILPPSYVEVLKPVVHRNHFLLSSVPSDNEWLYLVGSTPHRVIHLSFFLNMDNRTNLQN